MGQTLEVKEKTINLINKVSNIIDTEKEKALYTGNRFNIFNIIGISTKEVYMCRILAELLDPKGCHYQGDKYLEWFIDLLLEKSKNLEEKYRSFKNINREEVTIEKEDLTDYLVDENKENRRIDIVINEKNGHYIPIEVKINACEQPNQCGDYLNDVREYYKDHELYEKKKYPILCFLTKNGYKPTTIYNEDDLKQVICLSWKDDIKIWLDKCIKYTEVNSIKEVLIQFRNAIDQFANNKGDKTMEEIANYLIKNNCIETAISIREGVNIALDKLWKEFLYKITDLIKKDEYFESFHKIINEEWFAAYRKDDYRLQIEAKSKQNIKTGECKIKIYEFQYGKEKEIWSVSDMSFVNFDNRTIESLINDIKSFLRKKIEKNTII